MSIKISELPAATAINAADVLCIVQGAETKKAAVSLLPQPTISVEVPPGSLLMFAGAAAPSGWLLCDGAAYDRTDPLGSALYAKIGHVYDPEFSANATTDVCTCAAHGFVNTDQVDVHLVSGALPGGLSEGVTYYIINKTTDTFQLALTSGGAAINLTSAGSGRFTINYKTKFRVPDLRGRSPLGAGTGAGLTARTLGATGGEQTHQLTDAELPASQILRNTGATAGLASGSYITVGVIGSGAAHNTMHPFLVVNFIIKT